MQQKLDLNISVIDMPIPILANHSWINLILHFRNDTEEEVQSSKSEFADVVDIFQSKMLSNTE